MTDLAGLRPTEEWDEEFWAYNCPLQMWPQKDGFSVLNYMPRKERAEYLGELVTAAEVPAFCNNAAVTLRNLADLFEALGQGKIDAIYFPDETVPQGPEVTT